MTWKPLHNKEKYMINKGKICKNKGCYNIAKVKGYCILCYNNRRNHKDVSKRKKRNEKNGKTFKKEI